MKAPDKIYFDGTSSACSLPVFSSQNIMYIRKDALLEWAKANLQDRDNWNEKSAADAFCEMIDKLNSL